MSPASLLFLVFGTYSRSFPSPTARAEEARCDGGHESNEKSKPDGDSLDSAYSRCITITVGQTGILSRIWLCLRDIRLFGEDKLGCATNPDQEVDMKDSWQHLNVEHFSSLLMRSLSTMDMNWSGFILYILKYWYLGRPHARMPVQICAQLV